MQLDMGRTKNTHMEQRIEDDFFDELHLHASRDERLQLLREFNINTKRIKKNERSIKRKSNKSSEV